MKKTIPSLTLLFIIFLFGCQDTHKNDDKPSVFSNEQIIKLWDLAKTKELLGEPVISYNKIIDSTNKIFITQKISVQSFKLTIDFDENGKPVKPSTDNPTARMNNGSVFGTITCSSSCKSTTIGGGCTTGGCDPTGGACSAPDCGSGCFSYSCTKTSTGFGFGFGTVLF